MVDSSIITTPQNNSITTAKIGDMSIDKDKLGIMPSFSAYQSIVQSIPNATPTKIHFQTVEWDSHNWYDESTNYRYIPLIAGKYLISCSVSINSVDDGEYFETSIYKNGLASKIQRSYMPTSVTEAVGISALLDLNGINDYVEIFGFQNDGVARNSNADQRQTWFQALRFSA